MKRKKTKINGLLVYESKIFHDKRGSVQETFKKNSINKNLYLSIISKSKKNVVRGLHLQVKKSQDKLVSVVKGKILDVVVDLRKNSSTFGKHFKIILSENKGKYLFVPQGFAHGYLGLASENIVLYSCSNYRNAQYERCIQWNDKDLNIKWGVKNPILSKRDKNAQTLKKFIESK